MHIDIVVPHQNEQAFVEMAERLGWDGLCFVYDKRVDFERVKHLKTSIKLIFASHTEKTALLKLFRSTGEDRGALERGGFDVFHGMESQSRHDRLHHREGGLNHILCNLMHKHGIAYGINMNDILSSEPSKRAMLIGRMHHNFKLCADAKVPIITASFASTPYLMRTPHDLRATMLSFGMNTAQATESVHNLGTLLADGLK